MPTMPERAIAARRGTGHFGLAVSLLVTATSVVVVGSSAVGAPLTRRSYVVPRGVPQLVFASGGTGEAVVGLEIVRFGYPEVQAWYTLKKTSDGRVVMPHVSAALAEEPAAWAVGDFLRLGALQLAALFHDRWIFWEPTTKRVLGEFVLPLSPGIEASTGSLADLDGDGFDEALVATSSGALEVFQPEGLLWSLEQVGGGRVLVGQMDDDRGLEVAVGLAIVDTLRRSLQWRAPCEASPAFTAAGDIDGDGRAELLVSCYVQNVAWNVEEETEEWSTAGWGDVAVGDLDADGKNEVLVQRLGFLDARDGATLALEWSLALPVETHAWGLSLGELDGDTSEEIVFAALQVDGLGPTYLMIVDGAAGTVEWQGPHLGPPLVGPAIGDLEGDGRQEAVVLHNWEGDVPGTLRVAVLEPRRLRERWKADLPGLERADAVELADLAADAADELIVGAWGPEGALARAYSYAPGLGFVEIWSSVAVLPQRTFSALAVEDVDVDGDIEVMAGPADFYTQLDLTVSAFDAATGVEEWRSAGLPGSAGWFAEVRRLVIHDLDGDGVPEVTAAVREDLPPGGQIFVLDGQTHGLEATWASGYTTLEVVEQGPDALLALGTFDGAVELWQFDGTGYVQVDRLELVTGPIEGLRYRDGLFWVGSGSTLAAFQGERRHWISESLGAPMAERIEFARAPLEPLTTLAVGPYALHAFRRPPIPAD